MPSLSPLSSPLSQYKYFHSVSFHVLKAVVTLYFLTSVRVRDSSLCRVVGANFMISRYLYRSCSPSRSISQIISVWLTIPNSWSTTFIKPALKLSCVERVTSESFSCCRLLTVSWDFSLIRDRLPRTAIFCTLNDRLQSVNHRKFLLALKALFFDVKIN